VTVRCVGGFVCRAARFVSCRPHSAWAGCHGPARNCAPGRPVLWDGSDSGRHVGPQLPSPRQQQLPICPKNYRTVVNPRFVRLLLISRVLYAGISIGSQHFAHDEFFLPVQDPRVPCVPGAAWVSIIAPMSMPDCNPAAPETAGPGPCTIILQFYPHHHYDSLSKIATTIPFSFPLSPCQVLLLPNCCMLLDAAGGINSVQRLHLLLGAVLGRRNHITLRFVSELDIEPRMIHFHYLVMIVVGVIQSTL
jgi:hypothetical protein